MNNMGKIKLTPRLAGIAHEIANLGALDIIYEIGADHAYLPIYSLQEGICSRAVATDISEKSLRRARSNALKYNVSDKLDLFYGDGFSALTEYIAEKIVIIAGIGGVNLAEIILAGAEKARLASLLVLQPMHNHEALRKWLWESAFSIEREILVSEGRRIYNLLFCVPVDSALAYTQIEMFIGKNVIYNCKEDYIHFLAFTLTKIKNRLNGLNSSEKGIKSNSQYIEYSTLKSIAADIDALIYRYTNSNK